MKGAGASERDRGAFSSLSAVVEQAANQSSIMKMRLHRARSSLASLNTSDLRLHGRENDMDMLLGKLRNIDNLKDEIIMVSGSSGCGKSSLVMRGLREPAKKMGIAFCGGKFDLNNNALPYSAVVDSLTELANHVLASENVSQILAAINDTLGEEDMQLIGQAMPGCRNLLSVCLVDNGRSSHIKLGGGKEAVSRMQYAIRRLMKAIGSHLRVLIFIDDLQWADDASLDLLLSLQTDDEISSLLLVGAYRDNEVTDGHPLTIRLCEADKLGSTITTIELKNLDCKTVQSLVAEVLRMEDDTDKVSNLSTTIHKKTEGNPFFVLTFLTSIYDEELLEYNMAAMQWVWDDDIVKERFVTANVTSMLVSKLKRFKLAEQNVIKVASCLGASFSTTVLSTIIKESQRSSTMQRTSYLRKSFTFSDDGSDNLDGIITTYETAGIWERESEDNNRFVHDQIQSAAQELIPIEEQAYFKSVIGGILLKNLDEAMIDESLFVIVSLRNYVSSSLTEEERSDLVRLNARAGFKASDNAAFDTAVVYFQAARELLGSEAWEFDQELMVRLYSAEAQARFVMGDLVVMEQLIEEILSKEDLSVKDKFQAYETKVLAATSGNRFGEAISTASYVCDQLGFKPLPAKAPKSRLMKDYMTTKNALKGLSKEDILALPNLIDERVIMKQRMMELRLAPQYHANPDLHPIVVLNMVRETVKSGLNRSACDAFSTYGFILCGAFGELARGREMGEIAELLLERSDMRPMKSRTIYIVENMIYHWTAPLGMTLAPFLKGYQAGLESGDIDSAAYNLGFRGWNLWFSSRPLDEISHQLKINKGVLIKLKNENLRLCLLPHFQAAINLQGNSPKPELSGEEMVYNELYDLSVKTHNNLVRATAALTQLELFVIFQDWMSAKKLMAKAGDLRPVVFGFFQSVRYTFVECLICLKVAQASGSWMEKRDMKARAKKSLKILCGWAEKGNVNAVHTIHLLQAEYFAFNGNSVEAEEKYKEAVTAAARSGFLQDKALTHELAGKYYLKKGDDYWAKYHMNLAHTTYLDWKATAKAVDLSNKYPQFVGDDSE